MPTAPTFEIGDKVTTRYLTAFWSERPKHSNCLDGTPRLFPAGTPCEVIQLLKPSGLLVRHEEADPVLRRSIWHWAWILQPGAVRAA